jgi:transcriptional regulator with GAF, ATPase, and Fis domain
MIAPRLQRTNTDIEERNRADYLLLAEKRTLEMIAGGASLTYATGTGIEERKEAEERMQNEYVALREEIDGSSMFEGIVGCPEPLRRVLAQVAKVARTDYNPRCPLALLLE